MRRFGAKHLGTKHVGTRHSGVQHVEVEPAGTRPMAPAKLSVKELTHLLSAEFPHGTMRSLAIEEVWHGGCRIRSRYNPRSLRPGGTISGTTMMALADFTIYIAILATIGWVPLTVTTNLNINFLKKPEPRDLLAEARLLKLGKRLAVGEIDIRSEGEDDLVAHATSTYSLPNRR